MIIVTIELLSARTGERSVLGRMLISNVGVDSGGRRGDYEVLVANKADANGLQAIMARPQRRGSVTGFPRLSYNVWRLVSRAIRSAFPEEKG